jgi:hypothetical protein
MAVWPVGPEFRRGACALCAGEDHRAQAAESAVSLRAGADRDRRFAARGRDGPRYRGAPGALTVDGEPRDPSQQRLRRPLSPPSRRACRQSPGVQAAKPAGCRRFGPGRGCRAAARQALEPRTDRARGRSCAICSLGSAVGGCAPSRSITPDTAALPPASARSGARRVVGVSASRAVRWLGLGPGRRGYPSRVGMAAVARSDPSHRRRRWTALGTRNRDTQAPSLQPDAAPLVAHEWPTGGDSPARGKRSLSIRRWYSALVSRRSRPLPGRSGSGAGERPSAVSRSSLTLGESRCDAGDAQGLAFMPRRAFRGLEAPMSSPSLRKGGARPSDCGQGCRCAVRCARPGRAIP